MQKLPLSIGTQAALVPGAVHAIGQIWDMQPIAVHRAWTVSSSVVSLTQPWQAQLSDDATRCVHWPVWLN